MANEIQLGFGNRVRELREERGLSHSDLAERMGTTGIKVMYVEQGIYNPDLMLILNYCKALNISASELLSYLDQ